MYTHTFGDAVQSHGSRPAIASSLHSHAWANCVGHEPIEAERLVQRDVHWGNAARRPPSARMQCRSYEFSRLLLIPLSTAGAPNRNAAVSKRRSECVLLMEMICIISPSKACTGRRRRPWPPLWVFGSVAANRCSCKRGNCSSSYSTLPSAVRTSHRRSLWHTGLCGAEGGDYYSIFDAKRNLIID